jgi:hypothetical protein
MKVASTIGMRVAALEALCDQHSAQLSQRPEKGDTGPVGPQGESIRGADGESVVGPRGARGESGINGEHGRNGTDGKDAVGIQGPQGKAGRDGRDADVSVIAAALDTIQKLRDEMRVAIQTNNQARILADAAVQNDFKALRHEFAELRGEIENVRLLLQGFYDMNSKSGEYVAWLKTRTAKILEQSRAAKGEK